MPDSARVGHFLASGVIFENEGLAVLTDRMEDNDTNSYKRRTSARVQNQNSE